MRSNANAAVRSRYRLLTFALALGVYLCAGQATSQAAQPPVAAAAPVAQSSAPATSHPSSPAPGSAESYAAREVSAKDLENFRGGDIVIIGSTGAIILLLVLLILIIA